MIRYPDGHVLLRSLERAYPIVARGEGIYLFDEGGKRYVDGSSGALVASVGHGNREIAARIGEQLASVAYVNGMQFSSRAMEQVAEKLTALTPKGLSRVALLGSGSEAIEAAIKFARQLCVERGQSERTKIIARVPGYHGNTLFALSASGRPHYKKWFGPMLTEVITVSAPYGYRSPLKDYMGDGGAHYAQELDDAIERAGPQTICAFLFEPVSGSSTGASIPPPGYMDRISAVCRKHGVLMIADEVMCGAGRTGAFCASSHDGLAPDILVLGKGISGGYVPTSAVIVREDHLAEMKRGSGSFMHAQTYLQAPSMAAATLATLDFMEAHGTVANAAAMGSILMRELREHVAPLPSVGNVSGIGLLTGVEFVADKTTRAPFARKHKIAERFVQQCFDDGLILWPNTGQADGQNGDLVMIGPPLIIDEGETRALVAQLQRNIIRFFAKDHA